MEDTRPTTAVQMIEKFSEHSGLILALGVLISLLGLVALSSPLLTGISLGFFIAVLLIAGGVAQVIFAFSGGGGLWSFLGGILTVIAGSYMAMYPALAAATMTLVLLAFLLAVGVSDIMMSMQMRPQRGWGWLMLTGLLSIVLGVMIWAKFPVSGPLAIGILLGIRLLTTGITMIALAAGARRIRAANRQAG